MKKFSLASFYVMFLCSRGFAQTFQWNQTQGPVIVGSTVNAASGSGIIYATVLGPLHAFYESSDAGISWKAITCPGVLANEPYPNYGIAPYDLLMTPTGRIMMSANHSTGYLPDTIFRSTDNGGVWDTVPGFGNGPSLPSYSFFKNGDIVRRYGYGYLPLSTDGGKTWQHLPLPNGPGTLMDAATVNLRDEVYIHTPINDSIFRSTDKGQHWTLVHTSLLAGTLYGYAMLAAPDGSIYNFLYDTSTKWTPYLKSDPSGTKWVVTDSVPLSSGQVYFRRRLGFQTNGHLITLGDTSLFESKDPTPGWRSIPLPKSPSGATFPPGTFQSLVIDSLGRVIISGAADVYVSDDEQHWIARPIPHSMVNAIAVSPKGIVMAACKWEPDDYFAYTSSFTARSSDHGASWTRFLPGTQDPQFAFPRDSGIVNSVTIDTAGNFLLGATYYGKGFYPLRSKDDGLTWSRLPISIASLNFIVVGKDGILWSNYPYVERSSDDGSTWDQLSDGITSQTITCLAIAPNGNPFVGSQGTIFRNEQGPSWSKLKTGQHGSLVTTIAIDSSSILYAGTDFEGILRSTDNGDDWTPINSGLRADSAVHQISVLPNGIVLAATAGGLFYLKSGETVWHDANNGILDRNVRCIAWHDSLCYVGTNHDGVFKANIASLRGVEPSSASVSELGQNFPNPFSWTTTIAFRQLNESTITLIVRDMLGRTVKVLNEGALQPGMHILRLDAVDLPSGAYVYSVLSTSHIGTLKSVTRAMMIMH
jgi:photosystem II stability/assembly factor-like uncharacterized protein